MTERKPRDQSFESWVDRQIREATERGEFDDLPGSGRPIPDIDLPYDGHWWVRNKLRREGVSALPPTLALRREAEQALAAARTARTESEVRAIVDDINDRIRAMIKNPQSGPPLNLVPYDVECILTEWRESRHGD